MKQAPAAHVGVGYAWERARSHCKAWVLDARVVLDMIQDLGPIPSPYKGSCGTIGEAVKLTNKTFAATRKGPDAGGVIKDESARREAA